MDQNCERSETFVEEYTMVDAEDGKVIYQARERANSTPASKQKRNITLSQPTGTIKYDVLSNDTIERIALKYNTVPSEIMRLNRLSLRILYPGQVLYVPDPSYIPPPVPIKAAATATVCSTDEIKSDPASPLTSPTKSSDRQHFKWKPNVTPKPGHIELIKHSNSKTNDEAKNNVTCKDNKSQNLRHMLSEDEAKRLDEECMQRFLKINSKIITYNKGIIGGVLLITPSAVMFDPISTNDDVTHKKGELMGHSSDENLHQAQNDPYESTIIPIEMISNVILYEDLSIRDIHDYFELKRQEQQDASSADDLTKRTSIEKSASAELGVKTTSSNESLIEKINKIEETITKSDENMNNNRRCSITNIDNILDNEQKKLIRRLSTSLSSVNKKTSNTADAKDADNNTNETINDALKRHSINNIANLDNDDLLCYLCIKVNNHKDFISCPMDRKMKNRIQPEFWFQISDQRLYFGVFPQSNHKKSFKFQHRVLYNSYKITDKICAFFLAWKFDPTFALSPDMPRSRFQLVKDDSKIPLDSSNNTLSNKEISMSSSAKILSKQETFVKDWEIVNLYELEQKLKVEKENEQLQLPKLIGESKILKDDHLRILNCNLIARAVSYDWILTFSTETSGFSLNTLYRTMSEVDSPCLIVVMDTNRNIFGAMTSCKLYPSEHFYGTGESFLYTFYPSFKIYKWTGENNFFIKGDNQSLGIGCGDGMHGLWFDGDLYHGHTNKCKTYDNDILTCAEDFVINAVEVWTYLD